MAFQIANQFVKIKIYSVKVDWDSPQFIHMHNVATNMDAKQDKSTRSQHPGHLREGARYLCFVKMND